MTIQVSRAGIDSVYKLTLLVNFIFGLVTFIGFLASLWWVLLLLGTIGLPFTIGFILIYRFTRYHDAIKKYGTGLFMKLFRKFTQSRSVTIKRLYGAILWFLPRAEWKHISWGYATLTVNGQLVESLDEVDLDRRLYVQLYHYLATGFGNWNTLEGKNLLEIGSGGAGGLNYIAQYLNPEKCIGVDSCEEQIKFSKRSFGENPKMKFYLTDKIEDLNKVGELKDQRIDLALSVQNVNHIVDFKQFLSETRNVLKANDILIIADVRPRQNWAGIEETFESASFKVLKKEDISINVIQAIKIQDAEEWTIINRRIGSFIRKQLKKLGRVKENPIGQSLSDEYSVAKAYILQKV